MTERKISSDRRPASTATEREPNLTPLILVVDDDSSIRRLCTESLKLCGYRVEAAEDGAVAWDAVQVHRYDLMITDNMMPNMSGIELLKKLHAAHLVLPVST